MDDYLPEDPNTIRVPRTVSVGFFLRPVYASTQDIFPLFSLTTTVCLVSERIASHIPLDDDPGIPAPSFAWAGGLQLDGPSMSAHESLFLVHAMLEDLAYVVCLLILPDGPGTSRSPDRASERVGFRLCSG